MRQLRLASEMKLAPLGNRLQLEIPFDLVIENEFANVNIGIHGRCAPFARGLEGEIGTSFYRETAGLDLAHTGQIEIASGYVKTKSVSQSIVGRAAGNDGVVVEEMHFVECDLAV